MPASFLSSRLDYLASVQNQDGGLGYRAGFGSWLEPTFYAMLALHGSKEHAPRLESAWKLIRGWQREDGGVRPNGSVNLSTWATSQWVTLHAVAGVRDKTAGCSSRRRWRRWRHTLQDFRSAWIEMRSSFRENWGKSSI